MINLILEVRDKTDRVKETLRKVTKKSIIILL